MEPPSVAASPPKQKSSLNLFWRALPVVELIGLYDSCWSILRKAYHLIPFELNGYRSLLKQYYDRFYIPFNSNQLGIVVKRIFPSHTEVFVRADLHGDLYSLVANLKALQEQGLLTENFKCVPYMQLVFLGDYVDRGDHSLHVLQLLLMLHMENPDNVTLIRGNHEKITMNGALSGADPIFSKLLHCSQSSGDLERVYQAMPLAAYFATEGEKRQYVQFSHGAFEFEDINSLLSSDSVHDLLFIPKKRELSNRFLKMYANVFEEKLSDNRQKRLYDAAKRIGVLYAKHSLILELHACEYLTSYNWGDIQEEDEATSLVNLGARRWLIHPTDVKHYFNLNSPSYRLKFFFRGHQHVLAHHFCKHKMIGTTLPVSPECEWAKEVGTDHFYVLKMAPKVKHWMKTAYFRQRGSEVTIAAIAVPLGDKEL